MGVGFDRIWECGACVTGARGGERVVQCVEEVMKDGGSRSLGIHASQAGLAHETWLALVLYHVVC